MKHYTKAKMQVSDKHWFVRETPGHDFTVSKKSAEVFLKLNLKTKTLESEQLRQGIDRIPVDLLLKLSEDEDDCKSEQHCWQEAGSHNHTDADVLLKLAK